MNSFQVATEENHPCLVAAIFDTAVMAEATVVGVVAQDWTMADWMGQAVADLGTSGAAGVVEDRCVVYHQGMGQEMVRGMVGWDDSAEMIDAILVAMSGRLLLGSGGVMSLKCRLTTETRD